MKAISLWQPWASFVVGGFKKYETRSWQTSYRGPLAIHATKTEPKSIQRDLFDNPFANQDLYDLFVDCIYKMGYESFIKLPRGCIVGHVNLRSILPVESVRYFRIDYNERLLGDYSDGRFAWQLTNPIEFSINKVIPAKGKQGLWDMDPEVISEVIELLKEGQ